MNDIEQRQAADFLSIALECIEDGSYEVAADFVSDVADDLTGDKRETLLDASEKLENSEPEEAYSSVEKVNQELVTQIDDL